MSLDAKFVQGNSIVLNYTVTDEDGDPVDITGNTIRWMLKASLDAAATLTKSTGAGISITNGPGGVFSVTIDKTDIESVYGTFLGEAVCTDGTGKTRTVTDENGDWGTITIRRRITPAT